MTYNLKPSYAGVDELTTRDRGISIMYGRKPDALGGQIVPISVGNDGSLTVGSVLSLSTEDLNIGDVVVRGIYDPSVVGLDPEYGEARFGVKQVGDSSPINTGLYAVLVNGSAFTQPVNLTSCGGSPVTIGQKTSAESIPVVLASDQSITVGSITVGTISTVIPDMLVTGTITTENGTVQIQITGRSGIAAQFAGSWSTSLVAEISTDDAATWNPTVLFSYVPSGPIVPAYKSRFLIKNLS